MSDTSGPGRPRHEPDSRPASETDGSLEAVSPGAPVPEDIGNDGGWGAPNRRAKMISGVSLAIVGLAATMWAAGFGVGSVDAPGPGFWPALLGGILVVGAVVFALGDRDRKEEALTADLGLVALMLLAIVACIFLFAHVHFLVAAPLLLAVTQYLAGTRSAVAILLTSVLGTAGAWVLFFQILNVSLPL